MSTATTSQTPSPNHTDPPRGSSTIHAALIAIQRQSMHSHVPQYNSPITHGRNHTIPIEDIHDSFCMLNQATINLALQLVQGILRQ